MQVQFLTWRAGQRVVGVTQVSVTTPHMNQAASVARASTAECVDRAATSTALRTVLPRGDLENPHER
jgi:hypothetical protein